MKSKKFTRLCCEEARLKSRRDLDGTSTVGPVFRAVQREKTSDYHPQSCIESIIEWPSIRQSPILSAT